MRDTSDHTTAVEQDVRSLDARHHFHAFNNNGKLARTGSRVIVRAEGRHVWDAHGRRILDGMAGLWAVNIGYGRPEIARVAARAYDELSYYNTFFKSTAPAVAELAHRLAEIAPVGLSKSFFASSGSEANETVLKMVRYFWRLQGKPEKLQVIARERAYHGSTLATAGLSGFPGMHRQFGIPLDFIHHIPAPYWFRDGGDMSPEAFGRAAALALERKIWELGPENVGAFFAEPVQAAGGVIVPPESYWPEIQRICRQYDVLLVVDEVVCGFGRLGHWFGSQSYGIAPDLLVAAKGLTSAYFPLSAVMISDRIADAFYAADEDFGHGYTYSGHPVGCAIALENLRIMENEDLHSRGTGEIGARFAAALQRLGEHPLVGEVRVRGLLGAIELAQDRQARRSFPEAIGVSGRLHDICFDNGLISRAVGQAMALCPPLSITESEIDEMEDKMRKSLDQLQHELTGVA